MNRIGIIILSNQIKFIKQTLGPDKRMREDAVE